MNDYSFTVDTTEMARSLNSVSGNVKEVTVAVGAMQSAVIMAEAAAAKKICDNVDRGFYNMMVSQLSQKMAACSSSITSLLAKMQKFRSDIIAIKGTMEGDYNRISARYAKLFKALDRALEQRIRDLDAPAVKVAEYQKKTMRQIRNDSVSTLVCNADSQKLANNIMLAHLKVRTSKTIDSLGADVNNNMDRDRIVANMVEKGKLEKMTPEYVPVIISETESLVSPNTYVSRISSTEGAVKGDAVQGVLTSCMLEWQEDSSEKESITSSFIDRCEKDIRDERVRKEAIRMFNDMQFLKLGGIK